MPAPPATTNAPDPVEVEIVELARINSPDLIVPYVPVITLALTSSATPEPNHSRYPVSFCHPKNALVFSVL
jgi:hypothetical protein